MKSRRNWNKQKEGLEETRTGRGKEGGEGEGVERQALPLWRTCGEDADCRPTDGGRSVVKTLTRFRVKKTRKHKTCWTNAKCSGD